jgi:hypothetical protein
VFAPERLQRDQPALETSCGPLEHAAIVAPRTMPVALALLLALSVLAGCGGSGADERTDPSGLTDLSGVADLRGAFNEKNGVPRLMLFLSPT